MSWLALFVGSLLAVVGVRALSRASMQDVDELAFAKATASWDTSILAIDLASGGQVIQKAVASQLAKVLWLGNSQLPTIIDGHAGDRNATEILHAELLQRKQAHLLSFAPPNASIQEHLVLCSFLCGRLKPAVIILPLCFDDLRESGVRPLLASAFLDHGAKRNLCLSDIGRQLLEEHDFEKRSSSSQMQSQSTADQCEKLLDDNLGHWSHIWQNRGFARSLCLLSLYRLRNTIFGIRPDSVRKMIPARKERNLAALQAILDLAERNDCKVLAYIVPIRQDVPIPYASAEYEEFKAMVANLSQTRGFAFANLEKAVKDVYWGKKRSTSVGGKDELDYMHFKLAGHGELAREVDRLVQPLMAKHSLP